MVCKPARHHRLHVPHGACTRLSQRDLSRAPAAGQAASSSQRRRLALYAIPTAGPSRAPVAPLCDARQPPPAPPPARTRPPPPLSCVQSVAACSRASTRAAGQNLAAPCAQPPRSPRTMAAEQSCHRGGGCVARAYARRAGGAAAGRARTGQRAEKSPSDMNVKSIRAPFHPESCGACTAPGPRRVHGPRDRTTTPRPRRAPRRGGRVRLRVAHRAGFRAGVCLRADWLLRPPRQPGRARAGTAAAAMELELRRKELGACQPRCALPTPLGRVRERPAGSRGRCRARTAWCLPGR